MTCVTNAFQIFLNRLSLYSELGADEREAILRLPGRMETIGYHHDFARIGDISDQSCLVMDGIAACVIQNAYGERQITALHIPGDMPDLHTLVWPRRMATLQALTPVTIARVPLKALRALAARYPAIAEAFWRNSMVDSAITSEWLVNIGSRNARTRLAHLFCEMAIRFERIGVPKLRGFALPITQTDLSDALGLTPVHTHRMLKGLRGEGILSATEKGQRILDWPGLVRAGEFDPGYLDVPHTRLNVVKWPLSAPQVNTARAAP